MHIVIVGGGAALAQPLIRHFLLVDATHQLTVVCRTTLPEEPWSTRMTVVKDLGQVPRGIDVLITMVGSTNDAALRSMTDSQWVEVVNSTLAVPACALRRLLPRLKEGGNIVVVGSIVGSTGGFGCANYAAAKAGLLGLVRAAANEEAYRNVCINLLELGYVDAGMGARLDMKLRAKIEPTIPLKRFGTVADFVGAVDYLAKVRYMSGNVLTLAGGLR